MLFILFCFALPIVGLLGMDEKNAVASTALGTWAIFLATVLLGVLTFLPFWYQTHRDGSDHPTAVSRAWFSAICWLFGGGLVLVLAVVGCWAFVPPTALTEGSTGTPTPVLIAKPPSTLSPTPVLGAEVERLLSPLPPTSAPVLPQFEDSNPVPRLEPLPTECKCAQVPLVVANLPEQQKVHWAEPQEIHASLRIAGHLKGEGNFLVVEVNGHSYDVQVGNAIGVFEFLGTGLEQSNALIDPCSRFDEDTVYIRVGSRDYVVKIGAIYDQNWVIE